MSSELHYLTIAEAARLIQTRKLSPVELTDALLKRTEALDPQLNAFITLTADSRVVAGKSAEEEIARRTLPRPAARHPVRAEGHLQHARHRHDRRLRKSASTTYRRKTRRRRAS